MKQKLEVHLAKNLSFLKGKKLLIAISGGIDSVVLAHLFHELQYDIALAHCNFTLRGKESNKDEAFVKDLGTQLNVATHRIQFDTQSHAVEKGISTQMAARELRYNYFDELCKIHGFDYILTAHHRDDVLETFLMNMCRGTGLDGLTGIPEVNGNIVRPLLPFNQNEILVYATRNKLSWREDQSNSSLKYNRNRIRHKVVPVLKELNPSLLDSFQSTINNLKASQAIVKDSISKLKAELFETHADGTVHISITQLKALQNSGPYLYELLKEYSFTAWDDIADLLTAQTGKKILSETHILLKNRDELILSKIQKSSSTSYFIEESCQKIEEPIALKLKIIDLEKQESTQKKGKINEILLDYEALQFPLELRKWKKGDVFYPAGMRGKKKVAKYFKDEKFSAFDKEQAWILCSGEAIVWIVNHRMDDRFKISDTTKTALKIKS